MSITIFIVMTVLVVLMTISLLVPVRLQLILNDRRRSVFFSWLFVNLVSNLKEKTFELNFFNQTIVRKKIEKKTKERIKKAKKRGGKLNILDLWHKRDLLFQIIPIALRFLLDILRGIRLDRFSLEVDVATPDPALTGILFGELCAVGYSANCFFPEAHIKIQPDFVNQLPRGRAETVFSIRPLNVVAPVSKLFFALPKIKIARALLEVKRR